MDQICLKAYGKINLTLDVVGRRDDGYHLLSSVMQSISLGDTITLTKSPQSITINTDHPELPTDERNICWRAVNAFQTFTNLASGVEIELKKQIPMAAGLGGGSADAAAVLQGLNKLYETQLDLKQLQQIGLSVGADVPFCLQGGTCLVEGIGDVVTSLPAFPQASFVLVKPDTGVSTAQVYKGLDQRFHGVRSTQTFVKLLVEDKGPEVLGTVCENALESVTRTLVPEVNVWKKRLLAHGALGALMSGSGPTVFGLFAQEDLAQSFRNTFQDQAQIFVVKPINIGVCEMNGGDR
ncbi:MAG: 4-(cytidine 5'-diphospho)-2-C-methyl-D-erythritol kinase [Firmicutes bacterium]|nr:4-(cytidine 5'-diphospho)-2-C-methyl-D-erythritol kinase [Bacillota bacterium]